MLGAFDQEVKRECCSQHKLSSGESEYPDRPPEEGLNCELLSLSEELLS